jgi:hypothetical protein
MENIAKNRKASASADLLGGSTQTKTNEPIT